MVKFVSIAGRVRFFICGAILVWFSRPKLLFDRSVLSNVMLPLEIVGLPRRDA